MGEPTLPRNPDQDVPTRSGEEMGEREPLAPHPEAEHEAGRSPLPEEETYEHDREERSPPERNPSVED